MPIQPYLFLEGRCDDAIAFYAEALDAKVEMLMRYKDSPDPPPPGACGEKVTPEHVMHASLRIGDSEIMASDGMASGQPEFRGFSLSLPVRSETEARRRFDALASGGQVQMPLGRTFFSPCFGMVSDRFGVSWMVIVPA